MNEKWWSLETDEVCLMLQTDPEKGLSGAESHKRLKEHGFNEFIKEKKISPVRIFLHQFNNILVYILFAAIILSILAGAFTDAFIITIIVLFIGILGFIQEYRAEKALNALKKMLSPEITVLRDGHEKEIPSKQLVQGDILVLEAGDKIPADVRLIESHSLKCDEAPLTGESFPVSKDWQVLKEETSLNDRKNMLFTGTTVT